MLCYVKSGLHRPAAFSHYCHYQLPPLFVLCLLRCHSMSFIVFPTFFRTRIHGDEILCTVPSICEANWVDLGVVAYWWCVRYCQLKAEMSTGNALHCIRQTIMESRRYNSSVCRRAWQSSPVECWSTDTSVQERSKVIESAMSANRMLYYHLYLKHSFCMVVQLNVVRRSYIIRQKMWQPS